MFPIETISAKMLDYYVGRQDALIIDLREEEAFRQGHVMGARNIPYQNFEECRDLPGDKLLILYCERGSASLDAARKLAKKGYQVRSVIGGFAAYRGRNLTQ